MSVRLTIDLASGPVLITIRNAGRCTCAATGDIHESGCLVLTPQPVDVILDDPRRLRRRPVWFKRGKRR